MHGGVEVCNYPWDTWSTLTADDSWWQYVSQEYADSCQINSGNGYFNYLNDGITNGSDWYEVDGGRQDYMNYFKHCREFTLELSDDKTPDTWDLPTLWDANYPSLLNYMEQSMQKEGHTPTSQKELKRHMKPYDHHIWKIRVLMVILHNRNYIV